MNNQIIVTGGRDYQDLSNVFKVLKSLRPDFIIQGGCPNGVDFFAREYARENNVTLITVKADWSKYGNKAGPIRNKEMILRYPKAKVLFFKGGKGTKGCVAIAKEYLRETINGDLYGNN